MTQPPGYPGQPPYGHERDDDYPYGPPRGHGEHGAGGGFDHDGSGHGFDHGGAGQGFGDGGAAWLDGDARGRREDWFGDRRRPAAQPEPYGSGASYAEPYRPHGPYDAPADPRHAPQDPYAPSARHASPDPHEARDPYGPRDPHGHRDPYGDRDPYGHRDPYGARDPHEWPADPYGPRDPRSQPIPGQPIPGQPGHDGYGGYGPPGPAPTDFDAAPTTEFRMPSGGLGAPRDDFAGDVPGHRGRHKAQPPPTRRSHTGLVVGLVSGVVVLLLLGLGGVFLLGGRSGPGGAEVAGSSDAGDSSDLVEPVSVVDGWLTAMFVDKSAEGMLKHTCAKESDQSEVDDAIKAVNRAEKDAADAGVSFKVTWSEPEEISRTDSKARVKTTLTVAVGDKTEKKNTKLALVYEKGWKVCDAQMS
ncbi:MAG: hypothetical protein GEU94_13825 [Micromonosporaceae bacterium]|nr:hypothetical protein [Micromonosporaceae bacterium]